MAFAPGSVVVALALLAIVAVLSRPAAAQDPGIGNDEPTPDEIARRSKLDQLMFHRNPSRQAVIDELRDDKRKLREAGEAGIVVSDAEVDAAFASMANRMHMTADRLSDALAHAGIDVGAFKDHLRVDIAQHCVSDPNECRH